MPNRPTTTAGCLDLLVASKWAPPYEVEGEWKLQYVLTAPLLDAETAVKVTFSGGVATAELGMHASPDVTITMSGRDFATDALDELYTTKALTKGQARLTMHSPEAFRLVKRLGKSYRARP